MIRYSLTCTADHRFDSWFRNAAAFEDLSDAGRVACPDCGTTEVRKAPMTPRVAGGVAPPLAPTPGKAADLRAKIEAEAEYVGADFAARARAIHASDAPARPIYGEANGGEVRALLRDGIPVAPLPFIPKAKVN